MGKETREENERQEELKVERIHCPDCAVKIEKNVGKINGVNQAEIDPGRGKLKVSFDPQKINLESLKESVKHAGYNVVHPQEEKSIWAGGETWLTGASGLLLITGLIISFFKLDSLAITLAGRQLFISSLLYLGAIIVGGYYIARRGLVAIMAFSLDIDFLMTIAIIGAVAIGEYIEAASLAFLYSLAELLEDYSVDRARNSLRELMKLSPKQARIKREGEEITLSVEEVSKGEVIAIKPGERVGLDGKILSGQSSVDQSPITGESMPVEKAKGDEVYAGTINQEGYLEVEVTKEAQETALAKIIHLVEEAEDQKAPVERFVDRFARYYTPSVVAIALGVAVIPPLLLGQAFNSWFIKAITLLVIACPCALVISTPVSIVSAITSAAKNGVLIKGGLYLEEMGKVKAMCFDKTGTLTMGKPQVTDVLGFNNYQEEEVLKIAVAIERKSQHPLAQAVVRKGEDLGIKVIEIDNFKSITGQGVKADIEGKTYYIGKPNFFKQNGVKKEGQSGWSKLADLRDAGKTVVLVGTDEEMVGALGLADKLREGAKVALRQLKEIDEKLELVMITGDNKNTAQAIADKLGIDHFHSELLPQDKVDEVKKLSQKYGKVAMVGDGVNDAPALAAADIGIAMGAMGTDTAIETADIALMADELTRLPYLVTLSQKGKAVIRENIWASILIKFSLGAGVFPGLVTLVLAVLIGDMGATLSVTGNALRLTRVKA